MNKIIMVLLILMIGICLSSPAHSDVTKNIEITWTLSDPPTDLDHFDVYYLGAVGTFEKIGTVTKDDRAFVTENFILTDVTNVFGVIVVDTAGQESERVECALNPLPPGVSELKVNIVINIIVP